MRVSENFILQEFIHPKIYKKIGFRSLDFLHPYLVNTVQLLRERLQTPILINTWYNGGNYINSGLREPNGSVGAHYSAHRFGVAADLKFPLLSTNDALEEIMSSRDYAITRIESLDHTRTVNGKNGMDWMHIEVGNSVELEIFNP